MDSLEDIFILVAWWAFLHMWFSLQDWKGERK